MSITRKHALIIIAVAFAISRTAYLVSGNRYEVDLWYWQLLDAGLLKTQLCQSLLFLHSQPPLLNLLLGIGLKLFPESYPLVFQIASSGLGLALAMVLFDLIANLGVPVWLGLAVVLPFEVGPATLMFENTFYDTYATALALCLAASCLNRFLRGGQRVYAAAFACCVAAPVLLNSSFQVVWLAGVGGMLWFALRQRARAFLAPGLVVMAVVLAWYGKNLILFGTFTTSSRVGMILGTMSTFRLPMEERVRLVGEGKLSSLALMRGSFTPATEPLRPTGIPALDSLDKPGVSKSDAAIHMHGDANYNNLVYVERSEIELRDALWVVFNRPITYLDAVEAATVNYFRPATSCPLEFYPNRMNMRGWIDLYDRMLLSVRTGPDVQDRFSIGLLLVIPALTLFGLAVVAHNRQAASSPFQATVLFIVISVVYIGATGTLINARTNNRYRYPADPLYLALLAVFLTRIADRLRRTVSRDKTMRESGGEKKKPWKLRVVLRCCGR